MTDLKVKTVRLMTRVEGYSELTTYLDGKGLSAAEFTMPRFRDFGNVLVGKRVEDAPRLVARICGVCSAAQEIACCKALENALNIETPETANMLRLLMLMGETIRSHSINFFFMTLPDLVSLVNPLKRTDIIGVSELKPALLKRALGLTWCGEKILRTVGRRAVHPISSVVGGVSKPISKDACSQLLRELKDMIDSSKWTLELCSTLLKDVAVERGFFEIKERFRYLTSFDQTGNLYFYGGNVKIISESREVLEQFHPSDFSKHVKDIRWQGGQFKFLYATRERKENALMTGPEARAMLTEGKPEPDGTRIEERLASNVLTLNMLRLEEVLFCLSKSIELLENHRITNSDVRTGWRASDGFGSGVVEAPRGTLIHQYKINSGGQIESTNIVTPTNIKVYGINQIIRRVLSTCRELNLSESDTVEKLKMTIRLFDPCISCATHTKIG